MEASKFALEQTLGVESHVRLCIPNDESIYWKNRGEESRSVSQCMFYTNFEQNRNVET